MAMAMAMAMAMEARMQLLAASRTMRQQPYMIPWWRLAIYFAAGPCAWLALNASLANILRSGDSYGLASFVDDPVRSVLTLSRFDSNGRPRTISPAERIMAKSALIKEPLLPEAVWLLQPQDATKPEGDLRILQLSERLTRRDQETELSLAGKMVSNGDASAALVHLDHSLLARDQYTDAQISQLAAALEDPALRSMLARYAPRPWMGQVLRSAFANGPDPLAVASFVTEAGITPEQAEKANLPVLLRRLVHADQMAKAQEVARSFGWKGDIGSHGFAFSRASTDQRFVPLTWTPTQSDAIDGQIVDNGALRFEVQAGKGGQVLSRMTALQPGTYVLGFTAAVQGEGQAPTFRWALQCGLDRNGLVTWEQSVPLTQQKLRFRTRIEIPSMCSIQLWTVRASAFDSQLSSIVELDQMSMNEAR